MSVRTGHPFLDEPRERGLVLAMAHRGGAKHPDLDGLENTMEAFRHAVALGYRYLETDVHTTRDGHLLAFHDARLERITDGAGLVSDLTLAEVGSLRVTSRAGIPRLADLLEELPAARLNIDLKSAACVDPMADLLEHTGAHGRVCIGSFHEPTLRRFRRLVSRPVATVVGAPAVVALRFAPFPRLTSRLARDTGAVLQVPVRHRGLPVLGRRLIEVAHATGRHVHAWTIDERAEIERLLDLGVDGIITDRTDVLRDVLESRGLWAEST
jgi:glycerophosphoryl diester phosphodiesterase